jgi:hypothetical protein
MVRHCLRCVHYQHSSVLPLDLLLRRYDIAYQHTLCQALWCELIPFWHGRETVYD